MNSFLFACLKDLVSTHYLMYEIAKSDSKSTHKGKENAARSTTDLSKRVRAYSWVHFFFCPAKVAGSDSTHLIQITLHCSTTKNNTLSQIKPIIAMYCCCTHLWTTNHIP